jgi:lauroyl/myristoyl acyltransferase
LTAHWKILLCRTKWFALRSFLSLIFAFVFPLAARIGGNTARRITGWLGRLFYHLDIDWRTVSLRQHFVRERTLAAMREIVPEADRLELAALVQERFVCAAQEELDAHYLSLDQNLVRECIFEGLDAVREVASKNAVVYLTMHFDSAPMAIAQMGKAGLKVNFMTSNVVEDIRVPSIIRRFFKRKYDGIKRHLSGGTYWHSESNMRDFYRVLRRQEGVVVLCEAPAPSLQDGFLADFLGKTRVHKRGVLRLAQKTGAAFVGMICLRTGPARYKIVFSPVFEPSLVPPECAIREIFAFLSAAVRSSPGRWWAADLLPVFVNLGDKP